MSKQNFYRTTLLVEVLTQSPIGEVDLEHIVREMTYGDWVGKTTTQTQDEVLTGKQTVAVLREMGSDVEFFNLDEEGNDLEE